MAFNSLLNNMELIKRIYLNATNGHRYQEVTKGNLLNKENIYMHVSLHIVKFCLFLEEFLYSAQMMSQITPLEVDILFHLCDLLHQTG